MEITFNKIFWFVTAILCLLGAAAIGGLVWLHKTMTDPASDEERGK